MSHRYPIYVGHLTTENGMIVPFVDLCPVVFAPLNMELVERLLIKYLDKLPTSEFLWKYWSIEIGRNFIEADYSNIPSPALMFIAEYAEIEKALILHFYSFSFYTPDKLRADAAFRASSELFSKSPCFSDDSNT